MAKARGGRRSGGEGDSRKFREGRLFPSEVQGSRKYLSKTQNQGGHLKSVNTLITNQLVTMNFLTLDFPIHHYLSGALQPGPGSLRPLEPPALPRSGWAWAGKAGAGSGEVRRAWGSEVQMRSRIPRLQARSHRAQPPPQVEGGRGCRGVLAWGGRQRPGSAGVITTPPRHLPIEPPVTRQKE